MKKRNKSFVVVSALMFVASNASAAVLYDEAVSGDLDAIGSTNLDLGVGVNEIFGRLPGSPPSDSDRFKFTQLANLVVDSIVLSFTSAFDPAIIGSAFNLSLGNNQANLFDDSFVNATSGADITASFFDSFGSETGSLTQTTGGAIWDFAIAGGPVYPFQDWKLTVTTSGSIALPPPTPSPVPLPAGLPLLLAGLGGLGLISRRKVTS